MKNTKQKMIGVWLKAEENAKLEEVLSDLGFDTLSQLTRRLIKVSVKSLAQVLKAIPAIVTLAIGFEAVVMPDLSMSEPIKFKSKKEWANAGYPTPKHPISHNPDGALKTGSGTSTGK